MAAVSFASSSVKSVDSWNSRLVSPCTYRSLVLLRRRNCFTADHVPGLPVFCLLTPQGLVLTGWSSRTSLLLFPGHTSASTAFYKWGMECSCVLLVAFSSSLFNWVVQTVNVLWAVTRETSTTGCQQDPESRQNAVSLSRLRQHRTGLDEVPKWSEKLTTLLKQSSVSFPGLAEWTDTCMWELKNLSKTTGP